MKVKEISRTANMAWSPSSLQSISVACGTVAQQLDATFSSKPDALVAQTTQHTGAVRTLDVNPFQPNLLASGASDSDIFIWDLTNPCTVVYELPVTSQWIFEVHWCPRNPAIISTASFNIHISMYSLLGVELGAGLNQTRNKRL